MAQRPNDDLFAGTTMTFGEHLEELRICLFRALAGLFLGFLVGMAVANHVVTFIQGPLAKAIEKYYVGVNTDKLRKEYPEQISEEFLQFMVAHNITFEHVYLERAELRRLLEQSPKGENESQLNLSALESQVASNLQVPTPDFLHTRLWRPMRVSLKALNAQEVFMIWMKGSFVVGAVLASPWVFYQIWMFVAAGLYPHEKNYVYIYLPFSMLLFLAGAAMAFFFVFEPVLDFLFTFNKSMNIDPEPRISEWISFVLLLPVGFGISFQLPLVMLFLHRIGMISVEAYVEKWRLAILAIFVVSSVLTPADPVSLMFMAGPLTVLYFLGITLCKWMPRSRSPYGELGEV